MTHAPTVCMLVLAVALVKVHVGDGEIFNCFHPFPSSEQDGKMDGIGWKFLCARPSLRKSTVWMHPQACCEWTQTQNVTAWISRELAHPMCLWCHDVRDNLMVQALWHQEQAARMVHLLNQLDGVPSAPLGGAAGAPFGSPAAAPSSVAGGIPPIRAVPPKLTPPTRFPNLPATANSKQQTSNRPTRK